MTSKQILSESNKISCVIQIDNTSSVCASVCLIIYIDCIDLIFVLVSIVVCRI